MQAGQEFCRSKPHPDGGFIHDSYNSPDSINGIRWSLATRRRDIADYYRGLIALRKKFPEFRFPTSDLIREHVSFENLEDGALQISLGERLLVIINPLGHEIVIEAEGEVYADKLQASDSPLYTISGSYPCAPRSILVILRKETPAGDPPTVPAEVPEVSA